jgi:Zn-dependent protease
MEYWESEPEPVDAGGRPSEVLEHRGAAPLAPPLNRDDDGVLAEIERIERQKGNWVSALLTLVVSGLLFYWIGAAVLSWKSAALLIPILLFHELGHYLAMLGFRYRNLRMFFIPLFGAAVTGRHYNVPAWKKAVVALMGPTPGIAVGAVLGALAIVFHQKLLLEAAMLMVLVNGFNLLPVLPLDGGWNLHAILFSRHIVLDVGFRCVAAVMLILGAVFLQMHLLLYIGIAMLIALPVAFRIAVIAARLRREGLAAESLDSQSIPDETARRIIGEVRKAFPRRMNDKTRAGVTLQIFEALNARPAGWFATIALGGTHLAAFAVAIVAGSIFVVASRADLGRFIRDAADMPTSVYTCGTTLKWRGASAIGAEERHITVIGTFANRKKGEQAYQGLTGELPKSASTTLFGQTILVTLADDKALRTEWQGKLHALCPDVRVADQKSPASWTLVCIAPGDRVAQSIEHELSAYFAFASSRNLIPSWSTTPELTVAHRKARSTYSRVQALQRRSLDRARDASFTGDIFGQAKGKAALAKMLERMNQRHRESVATALSEVRREGENEVDLELARLYEAWALPKESKKRDPDEARKLRELMADRMGRFGAEAAKSKAGALRESADSGYLTRNGPILRVNWVTFPRPEDGLPALAEWLCAQHCIEFKYRLEPLPADRSEDSSETSDEDD